MSATVYVFLLAKTVFHHPRSKNWLASDCYQDFSFLSSILKVQQIFRKRLSINECRRWKTRTLLSSINFRQQAKLTRFRWQWQREKSFSSAMQKLADEKKIINIKAAIIFIKRFSRYSAASWREWNKRFLCKSEGNFTRFIFMEFRLVDETAKQRLLNSLIYSTESIFPSSPQITQKWDKPLAKNSPRIPSRKSDPPKPWRWTEKKREN